MMDDVGPDVLPSVVDTATTHAATPHQADWTDAVFRRLLGMESKLAQYRDGAEFVSAVVADVGLDGFNRVWTSPETLADSRLNFTTPRAGSRRIEHGPCVTRSGARVARVRSPFGSVFVICRGTDWSLPPSAVAAIPWHSRMPWL